MAHLARLARLALTDEELDSFSGQLDAILEHVSRIQSVDVTGVEATDNPISRRHGAQRPGETAGIANVTRPDTVIPGLTQSAALAEAPRAEQGRFAVPQILGEGQ